MGKWTLDLGLDNKPEVPLEGRKSITILLGAGFSAPRGYPIGSEMNERILNFDKYNVDFTPSGELFVNSEKDNATNGPTPLNLHQKYFIFCKRLINEYYTAHSNTFDYELFYDFIKSSEAYDERYQLLCADLCNNNENYDHFILNISHIYNQMVEFLLKDRDGKNRYDNEPFHIGSVEDYNEFLKLISSLSRNHIVNIYTLNHDLLFESFNKVEIINGKISDGFDEYGSDYYGMLKIGNMTYRCRLERYTGKYNKPIRLFKLHGSIDYVIYYKTTTNGIMVPEKYVKIKYGISPGDVIKSRKSKIGYDISPFPYHADWLTGTTSKTKRYNEPLLFKKLFKKFKNSLKNTEILLIIGYGGKDDGINQIIIDNFDYNLKPVHIVDKFGSGKIEELREAINATMHKIDIKDIKEDLFVASDNLNMNKI